MTLLYDTIKKKGTASTTKSPSGTSLYNSIKSSGTGVPISPQQEAINQHAISSAKQQEFNKKMDERLAQDNKSSFPKSVGDFFKNFSPSNIKSTIKNTTKGSPLQTAASVGSGLLDVGPAIANTAYNVKQGVSEAINNPIRKKLGLPIIPTSRNPFPLTGKEASAYSNNTSDLSNAISSSVKQVAGYELGGAITEGLPITNLGRSVLGNILGGQFVTDAQTAKERGKQALFDAAFGVATETVGAIYRGVKKLGATKAETPMATKPDPTVIYKPKSNLGKDLSGQKILGKTEFDSKTGNAIIYYDQSLDANQALKSQTLNHELGHVIDKRLAGGSNLSAQLPNYKGNASTLDVALGDFALKQKIPVEQVTNQITQEINSIAMGSNLGEQFANAVKEYIADPSAVMAKAPTFAKLLAHELPPSITEHIVTKTTLTEPQNITTSEFPTQNPIPKELQPKPLIATTPETTKISRVKTEQSKFSSTGLKTGKTVKTEGYNPSKINAPEDTQALFKQLGAKNTNRISKSNEDVRDLARLTGLTEKELIKAKPGSIANAETVTAARQLVLDKANNLMNELKSVDVSVATTEQLKSIKDKFVTLVSMQKSVAGLRTEASNVFRSLGLELAPGENATLQELAGVLKKAGIASEGDASLFSGKVAKEFNLTKIQKVGQGALSTWYAAILSGPKTTARNILSTSANILTEFASKFANPKQWKEIPASTSGLFKGLSKGINEGWEVLKGAPATGKFAESGNLRPSPFETNFASPLVNKTIHTYGTIVESVGRFLNAQDTFLKAGVRGMEEASLKVQKITDESLVKAISNAYGESTVYHGVPKGRLIGALRDTAQTLRSKFPESKIIIPFVDTVANVLDRQFDYMPIISALRLRDSVLLPQVERIAKDYGITSSAEKTLIKIRLRDQQIGRMVLGTGVSTTAIAMATKGRVSGVGPTNVAERTQLQETGWRPNSIKIGNIWIPYANLGPLAGIFAMAGNVYDKTHYDQSSTNSLAGLIGKGLIGWTQTQLNSSFLSGTADLLDVLNGGTDPGKYLTKLGAGLVPVPALYTQTKDIIWRQQYETRNIVDKLQQRLGITGSLEPRLDAFGRFQKGDLIYGLTPSAETNDPVIEYLVENNLVVAKPNLGQQYSIPGSNDKRSLTPREYTQYLRQSGDAIYTQIEAAMDSYKNLPMDEQKKLIAEIVDSQRQIVRNRILAQ